MDEVWRSVPSLEGVKASSLGRILLPPRRAKMPHGAERTYTPKPTFGYKVKAEKHSTYVRMIYHSRYHGSIKIHQAVCEAFHGPKPFPKAVVIHLDEDGTNNRPENLKWGTQKENLNMPKIKEYHISRVGEMSPMAKHKAKLVLA